MINKNVISKSIFTFVTFSISFVAPFKFGIVNAATTPITPITIRVSAKVNAKILLSLLKNVFIALNILETNRLKVTLQLGFAPPPWLKSFIYHNFSHLFFLLLY